MGVDLAMSCEMCVVTAEIDGRQVNVNVFLERMDKVAVSIPRGCILYHCPQCGTFWESCAYEPWPREVDAQHVLAHYPDAQKYF